MTEAPVSPPSASTWPARVATAAGVYAIAAGAVVMTGWAADVQRLTDWRNDGISMFPNAALCAMLSGLALVLAQRPSRRARDTVRACAAVVAAVGAVTLLEHLTGVDAGIDTLLWRRPWGHAAAAAPMRMGPPGSAAFLLTGAGLLLATSGARARRASAVVACVTLAIGMLSLTGHLYGASQMYTLPRLTGIALSTATVVVALGLGLMASLPDREPARTLLASGAAGVLTRQALPVVVVLSVGLGAVRVWIERHGLTDAAFGTALRSLIELGLTTALLWWAAARLQAHEAALRASEADVRNADAARGLLAAMVSSSDDAIVSTDLAGDITSWNPGAERLYGYTASEAVGRPKTALVPRELHDEEPTILERIRKGHRIEHYETVRQRKDGTRVDISLTVSPILDANGTVVGASKIARDITERKEAAARATLDLAAMTRLYDVGKRCIRAGDHLVEDLSEILDAALSIAGADKGNVQLCDEATGVLKLVVHRGFGPDFVEFFSDVGVEHPSACGAALASGERVVVEDVTQSAVFAGQPSLDVVLAAGVRAVHSTPLVSGTGTVIGVISTHFVGPHRPSERECRLLDLLARQTADYVERKRAEQQRESLLRIAQRAREDAEAANRAKDEFLAMLGHELRNPLAAVRNAIAAATLDETHRDRALDIARRQALQLGRIVDDLLDVARITTGRVRLRREHVSLAEVVQRAVDGARALLQERGHALVLSLPADPVHLEADPSRVEQAVANVLANAAKYTDPGGTIAVTAERQGVQAVVRVRDNGMGIPPELLPHVFDLFAQGDRALDRAQGGLGIGLTLVRRIVELHGGTVEAKSPGPGAGAEFALRLPALPPTVQRITLVPAPATPAAVRRHARVLMVEDNPDAAESLGMILELLGHQVRVAGDGLSALEAARTSVPDVMLVDIGLPGMNGYEVAKAVRRDPALRHVVLIALTGYGRADDEARAIAAGFDHHLVKPVDLDALGDLVGRLGSSAARPAGHAVH